MPIPSDGMPRASPALASVEARCSSAVPSPTALERYLYRRGYGSYGYGYLSYSGYRGYSGYSSTKTPVAEAQDESTSLA